MLEDLIAHEMKTDDLGRIHPFVEVTAHGILDHRAEFVK